jgi:hypothetical protein
MHSLVDPEPGPQPTEPSVQSLVDALSVALGRPVLLDDATLAPLAYSRQWEVDAVRSESILGRGASAKVREALLAQAIASARDVVHTVPDPELGMEGRVCMPVRDRDQVLGYIWLLDPEEDMEEAELEKVRRTAAAIAAALAGSSRRTVADEAALLEALCSSDPEVRGGAAGEARRRGLLPDERLVLCLLAPLSEDADPAEAARAAARRLSVGQAIAATDPVGAALVASLGDPVLRTLAESEVGVWLREVGGADVAVGESAPAALQGLDEAHRQAGLALRAARARRRKAAVTAWTELGADRLVAQLPPAALKDLPEGLVHLLREEPELVETLAVFLEAGGEIKATAAALSLHRSGLYYRLRRIEELSGLDLSSGDDRLLAHLAIRTEQMS